MNRRGFSWEYAGDIYVRPIGRGVVLNDYPFEGEGELHLEEVLPEGKFAVRIEVSPLNDQERSQGVSVSAVGKAVACRLPSGLVERLSMREARELMDALAEVVDR